MPKATRAAEALSATPTDEDRQFDLSLRPTQLDEYIGQTQVKENLRVYMKAARETSRGARPRSADRPAGLGKDHAGAHHRQRNGRGTALDLRPGDRKGRRHRGAADQSAGRRRALHRRDSSPAAGARRKALSGDGGFQSRSSDWSGRGARSIKLDLPKFTLVGATTRAGTDHRAFARTLWHHLSSRFLSARRSRNDLQTFGRDSGRRDRRRRRP